MPKNVIGQAVLKNKAKYVKGQVIVPKPHCELFTEYNSPNI